VLDLPGDSTVACALAPRCGLGHRARADHV